MKKRIILLLRDYKALHITVKDSVAVDSVVVYKMK